MKTLMELIPRDAGSDVGEPDVPFGDPGSLHEIAACPATWGCTDSVNCLVTYPG